MVAAMWVQTVGTLGEPTPLALVVQTTIATINCSLLQSKTPLLGRPAYGER